MYKYVYSYITNVHIHFNLWYKDKLMFQGSHVFIQPVYSISKSLDLFPSHLRTLMTTGIGHWNLEFRMDIMTYPYSLQNIEDHDDKKTKQKNLQLFGISQSCRLLNGKANVQVPVQVHNLCYSPSKWLRNSLVTGSHTFHNDDKCHRICMVITFIVIENSKAWSGWHRDNQITRNTLMANRLRELSTCSSCRPTL